MKWSQKELNILREKYPSHSVKDLSKVLKRSENAIYSKASQLSLSHLDFNRKFMRDKSRKYKIDHHYFDSIDSEEKAYFLGILFADGYNYEKRNHISLGLQEKDRDLLAQLNECIGNERPLFYKVDDREGRKSKSYILSFSSDTISNRLAELGCGQNKTDGLCFPAYLREDLIKHFIRGFFDGDGSIIVTVGKNGEYETAVIRVSITGNQQFIQSLYSLLSTILSPKGMSVIQDKRRNNVFYMSIGGHQRSLDFLRYLYEGATIYMSRKNNLYKSVDIGLNNGTLRGRRLIDFIKNQNKENYNGS